MKSIREENFDTQNRLKQCCECDHETLTMVSRFECTGVHFVQVSVSVSVSRPQDPGHGLGLET